MKGAWNSIFSNSNPIVLELGCGKGEYTLALAERYPEKNFIGIDIKGSANGAVLPPAAEADGFGHHLLLAHAYAKPAEYAVIMFLFKSLLPYFMC